MPGAIPLSVVTIFIILTRELSILLVFIKPVLGFVNPVYIYFNNFCSLLLLFKALFEYILLFISKLLKWNVNIYISPSFKATFLSVQV